MMEKQKILEAEKEPDSESSRSIDSDEKGNQYNAEDTDRLIEQAELIAPSIKTIEADPSVIFEDPLERTQ